MKRILITIFAALLLVSCDLTGSYSRTYPVEATFEYKDAQYQSDSLTCKTPGGYGFGWEYLAFRHVVDTLSWEFHGGMMLSCQKGKLYNPQDSAAMAKSDSLVFAEDRFRVHSAKGAQSNAYLVHFANPDSSLMPVHDIEFVAAEYGTCKALGCYVNNTGYVAYKVAKTFQPGDRLTLKATGYLSGVKTGEASITLADFSAQKDSIVSVWTPFELGKLQPFDNIDFEVISTKKEVPAYFCLDFFVASASFGDE